jgi:hypothetical protein
LYSFNEEKRQVMKYDGEKNVWTVMASIMQSVVSNSWCSNTLCVCMIECYDQDCLLSIMKRTYGSIWKEILAGNLKEPIRLEGVKERSCEQILT